MTKVEFAGGKHVDDIRKRLIAVQQQMSQLLRARDAANARERVVLQEEESAHATTSSNLRNEMAEKLQQVKSQALEDTRKAGEWRKRSATRIEGAYTKLKNRTDTRMRQRMAAWEQRKRDGHEQAFGEYEEHATTLKVGCKEELTRLDKLAESAELVKRRIELFATEHGLTLQKPRIEPPDTLLPTTDEAEVYIARRIGETDKQLTAAQRKLKRRIPALISYFFVTALHAGGAAYLQTRMPGSPFIIAAGGTVILSWAMVFSLYLAKKQRAFATGQELLAAILDLASLAQLQKQPVNARLEDKLMTLEADKIQSICRVDDEVSALAQESNKSGTEALEKLRARREKLIPALTQRHKEKLDRAAAWEQQQTTALRAEYKAKLDQCSEQYTARTVAAAASAKQEIERLAAEWSLGISGIGAFGAEQIALGHAQHPDWQTMAGAGWSLPTKFADQIYLGDVSLELTKLLQERDPSGAFSVPAGARADLPLLLSFPLNGSLLVRSSAKKRERAMQLISNVVLRLLSAFPATKAKLTIIDPVGLGQNFASLMHLADYDDSLVGGKIWSDVPHIERKLTELTEHMEKVIQKYLRNRYESIDQFNREAGEMAEPYRFLVIADFPTGFSELALERLASIVNSGARCGVYTIMLQDDRQKLPAPLSDTALRKSGIVITEHNDNFAIDDETLCRALVTEQPAPAAPLVDALVNGIGRQCQAAARVQVPFEAAAPKPSEYWSSTAHDGIRVPLGKAGADRLQYMHLGKGTAQHALIAGKTGSGKSNLFHTIVTNTALWYSPAEVEFYLIDFKKGVEFKTYGVNELPHARVIAIESDREFGLSVLRRIDRELSARGELFRRARVQDYPSFRAASPTVTMPRSMLIIDEFQEFFVDDDAVAQDAALLLDRIVRQGRAFGIHVVLGSQTLGGTYTLSKSTLGQMAVRIALQCNESDSYLILNDDNSAAALLSRPGEAIYNDQSGLVEGNNPFQAVFLPKDVQEVYLRAVHEKSAATNLRAPETAVFEGNSLAELRNNRVLFDLARNPQPLSSSARVWLGEANAIKGPTEVEFIRQAGNNLLIVGQRGDSELALCCAALLSLAAGNSPENARIVILDGTLPDSGARQRLQQFTATLPHKIEIVDFNRAAQAVEDLSSAIKDRQNDGGNTGSRTFLMVLGLERFRALREDDEYGFSTGSDEGAAVSASKAFVSVLTDGPGVGVHTLVWCDTLGNLNRTFSRKTLKEFEMRVLFQMSANNSSELIDTPAANRLGLYNALLYTAQNGGVEKFRPYALPTPELLDELGRTVALKGGAVSERT